VGRLGDRGGVSSAANPRSASRPVPTPVPLRFSPNLSILWQDVPLEERFARAAAAGFGAVELWWPGPETAERLPELTGEAGVRLALLNFDAGDMAAGDRGLASDPDRRAQLRENVPSALRIAAACGCTRLNLLLGLRRDGLGLDDQLALARENVRDAAALAAEQGATVLVEAVNECENGPYLVTRTADAAAFVESVGLPNVRLQYDAYHMQRMEGDLATNLERVWPLVGHVQVADAPGRNQPGTGEINYRFLLGLLERKGYDGYVGLEYKPLDGRTDESFGWIEELGYSRSAS
jgi:hydroxypyruvate isomerase